MSAKTILIFFVVALFSVAFSMPTEKVDAPKENMKTAETVYDYSGWSPYISYGYPSGYASAYASGYPSSYSSMLGYRSALPYYGGLNYNHIYSDWLLKK